MTGSARTSWISSTASTSAAKRCTSDTTGTRVSGSVNAGPPTRPPPASARRAGRAGGRAQLPRIRTPPSGPPRPSTVPIRSQPADALRRRDCSTIRWTTTGCMPSGRAPPPCGPRRGEVIARRRRATPLSTGALAAVASPSLERHGPADLSAAATACSTVRTSPDPPPAAWAASSCSWQRAELSTWSSPRRPATAPPAPVSRPTSRPTGSRRRRPGRSTATHGRWPADRGVAGVLGEGEGGPHPGRVVDEAGPAARCPPPRSRRSARDGPKRT